MSWFGLRVYAVTHRKKLPNGALFFLVAANLFFGIYSTTKFGLGPSKFLNNFFVRVQDSLVSSTTTAGCKLRCVQGLHLQQVAVRGAYLH